MVVGCVDVLAIPRFSKRSSREVSGGKLEVESEINLLKSWSLPNSPFKPVLFLNRGCWQPTKLHTAIANTTESMCLRIED